MLAFLFGGGGAAMKHATSSPKFEKEIELLKDVIAKTISDSQLNDNDKKTLRDAFNKYYKEGNSEILVKNEDFQKIVQNSDIFTQINLNSRVEEMILKVEKEVVKRDLIQYHKDHNNRNDDIRSDDKFSAVLKKVHPEWSKKSTVDHICELFFAGEKRGDTEIQNIPDLKECYGVKASQHLGEGDEPNQGEQQ